MRRTISLLFEWSETATKFKATWKGLILSEYDKKKWMDSMWKIPYNQSYLCRCSWALFQMLPAMCVASELQSLVDLACLCQWIPWNSQLDPVTLHAHSLKSDEKKSKWSGVDKRSNKIFILLAYRIFSRRYVDRAATMALWAGKTFSLMPTMNFTSQNWPLLRRLPKSSCNVQRGYAGNCGLLGIFGKIIDLSSNSY